jgi:hypothetical protein
MFRLVQSMKEEMEDKSQPPTMKKQRIYGEN